MMSQNYVFIEQWPIRFELPVFVQWYCFRPKKLNIWHQSLSRCLRSVCGLGMRLVKLLLCKHSSSAALLQRVVWQFSISFSGASTFAAPLQWLVQKLGSSFSVTSSSAALPFCNEWVVRQFSSFFLSQVVWKLLLPTTVPPFCSEWVEWLWDSKFSTARHRCHHVVLHTANTLV